ncbi:MULTISPECIES: GAF and ANTAR domain-containing protein [unclassified Kribbella]|uniref:GAF and ANTAR domain-containing protein n=1 Tax=unclassified Kribbella TaxID=2644121 RepID=UPI003407F3A1
MEGTVGAAQRSGVGRAHELVELATELVALDTVAATAALGVAAGRELLGAEGAVSIQVRRRRRLTPVAASDPLLALADAWQVADDEGPAVDVAAGAASAGCSDLATTPLWPGWASGAAALGWRGWLSVPLIGRRKSVLGVLTYAHPKPDTIGSELAGAVAVLSSYLSIAIDTARTMESLAVAADSQAHVAVAVGLLMERYRLNAEQAFSVLSRYSQDRNVKVRDLATDLILNRRLPGSAGQGALDQGDQEVRSG